MLLRVREARRRGGLVALPEARRFCDVDFGRHLDEATPAADQGTREKAARGDTSRILDSCLSSLAHYLVAREILVSPAQEHALSGFEIVIQSVVAFLKKPS